MSSNSLRVMDHPRWAWWGSRDPFLPRDAMLAQYVLWPCVCLSLCSSVTGGSTSTAQIGVHQMGCTVAPPGKYNWTVCARLQCGLVSTYCDRVLFCCRTRSCWWNWSLVVAELLTSGRWPSAPVLISLTSRTTTLSLPMKRAPMYDIRVLSVGQLVS